MIVRAMIEGELIDAEIIKSGKIFRGGLWALRVES
jgi:hypothetical protein